MENTKVVFRDHIHGEVQLISDGVQAGKMDLAITGGRLAVFHTEVNPEFEGRGFAKLLLEELVRYAREQSLTIIPLCPYVNAQFRRHPAQYEDVWNKDWHR
ncbi:GNAT family N-acetyltransferase [Pedobacter sp. SYP-B3415]|uniref:GNAT family N-acetyltransferase n=1 Tax=Pedobacter sp. SYP-B3415 TaxID=2496641 RepID=UPI00101D8027|nr:GNAT family N-acetyltransferase [Pedobacter sp. SYP-B3415]